ncbi:MAG: glycosyltransferase family 39 protein [Candidatus Omnitrophica bacterium]|nr:glycosyltransferase family 39 protein [Candidatus Omnitrophota bacterium]
MQNKRFLYWKYAFSASLALLLLIALRLNNFPQFPDYDEQVMYLNGRTLALGGNYSDIAIESTLGVGINSIYAVFYKLFGFNPVYLRIFGICLGMLSLLLLFQLSKMLFNLKVAFFSSAIFGIFSSLSVFQGNTENREIFFIPFVLSAFIAFQGFLLNEKKSLNLALAGFLLSAGFLIKQVVLFDAFVPLVFLFILYFRRNKAARFFSGALFFVSGAVAMLLLVEASFFLLWHKSYIHHLFTEILPAGTGHISITRNSNVYWSNFKANFLPIFANTYILWVMAVFGIAVSFFKRTPRYAFLLLWCLFSSLGVSLSGWWFPHYFLQMIPALSILAAVFFSDLIAVSMDYSQKKYLGFIKYTPLIFILPVFLVLVTNLSFMPGYVSFLGKKISLSDYLKQNKLSDWNDRVEAGKYLYKAMNASDKLYVWDTTPAVYLEANKQVLDPRFTYNQSVTGQEFLLLSERDSFPADSKKLLNRKLLMETLYSKSPEYIVARFEPEYGIRQMFTFPEFNDLIFSNYHLVKRFGDVFVYKLVRTNLAGDTGSPKGLDFDLIRFFAAITRIEEGDNSVKVSFEPMVNTGGTLKEYSSVYAKDYFNALGINFLNYKVESVQRDENGVLLIRLSPLYKQGIYFMRFKMEGADSHWCNKSYGVNRLLYLQNEQNSLLVKVPFGNSEFPGKTFIIDGVYEDGTLARAGFKYEDIRSIK